MQKVFPEKTRFYVPICCLYLSKAEKKHFLHPILWNGSLKSLDNAGNHANLKCVQPQPSPFWGEFVGKIYQTWNLGKRKFPGVGENSQLVDQDEFLALNPE